MIKLNHKTDFHIVEELKDTGIPFRFTFFVKKDNVSGKDVFDASTASGEATVTASFDGVKYSSNCRLEDGRLYIFLDNTNFNMGALWVHREFYLDSSDYSDNVQQVVSNEAVGVRLTDGANDTIDTPIESSYVSPFVASGLSWSALSEEERSSILESLGNGVLNDICGWQEAEED